MTFAYPLIATYLLTGGRHKEVLGLQVKDINFDRKTLTFRPNEDRHVADPIGGYAHRKELEFLDVPEPRLRERPNEPRNRAHPRFARTVCVGLVRENRLWAIATDEFDVQYVVSGVLRELGC